MTKLSLKTGCKNFIQLFQNQGDHTLVLPPISNHVQAYAIAGTTQELQSPFHSKQL
ncbi:MULTISPECIES: hypothetical protein [unclassified Nostoc]|uniref:hypothetical protein n=1 Tax=unclassified Nostoc TaxID=2593658 RepID=UPI002FFC8854